MRHSVPLRRVAALLLILGLAGCGDAESELVRSILGEWTATDAAGSELRLSVGEREVRFTLEDGTEFDGSYSFSWYQEADRTMGIKLVCEGWNGVTLPIGYRVEFTEDLARFSMHLNGRTVAVFTRVATEPE